MNKISKKALILAVMAILILLPLISFGSKKNDIFVDDESTASDPDGSSSKPYKTISEALKHAKKDDEIHISSGTYKENIEIPKEVEVYGTDKDKVFIVAKDTDKPVVIMHEDTVINKVTIQKGEYGILVEGDDDEVSISKCVIKDNDKDGIKIKEGTTDSDEGVSITKSTIKDNGKAGIYSEKRRIVLMDSEISENGSDGADFESGTSSWIENNDFNDNEGSGLKVRLDNSKIYTDDNTYSGNDHDGIEVVSKGKSGIVSIQDSKIYRSGWYGIARIEKEGTGKWSGLTVDKETAFWKNELGDISPILK